jgi:hypothetical protein
MDYDWIHLIKIIYGYHYNSLYMTSNDLLMIYYNLSHKKTKKNMVSSSHTIIHNNNKLSSCGNNSCGQLGHNDTKYT